MPVTKQTIAIIGSNTTSGRTIARRLCVKNYRLLLFDKDRDGTIALSEEIGISVEDADVEYLSCAHLASWEADIIIITDQKASLQELSDKTRDVSTQKIIAIYQDSECKKSLEKAESLFPHSRLVAVIPDNQDPAHVELQSAYPDALAAISELFALAGFDPEPKKIKTS